jgi:hypothetical protein
MSTLKDKWAGATLQESLAVARFGKLARSGLAQAAIALQSIDQLITEAEESIKALADPLHELHESVLLLAVQSRAMTAIRHSQKLEAFKLWKKWEFRLSELEKQFQPSEGLTNAKGLLAWLQEQRMEAWLRWAGEKRKADRVTRHRVKELLAKERPVDDVKAHELLLSVKKAALAGSYGLERYVQIGRIYQLPLSSEVFRCELDADEIERAMRAGKGKTEAKEIIRKAHGMGLWLQIAQAYADNKPHECLKCAKVITEPRRRLCDDCYVETHNRVRWIVRKGEEREFNYMINWKAVPIDVCWPRGRRQESSWEAADSRERLRADMASGDFAPGYDQKPVREAAWQYGDQSNYLDGWKQKTGNHCSVDEEEEKAKRIVEAHGG